MNLRQLVRTIISEAFVDASGNLVGLSSPKQRRFATGAKTRSANELLKFVKLAPITCAQIIADNNGDMRTVFDFVLGRLKNKYAHWGTPMASYREDEEEVFYDFAANYPKEQDYWEQMGRRILGQELWDDHLNGKSVYYQRYAMISVRNEHVEETEKRISNFGWWHHTFEPTASLGSTTMMIAPVPVKVEH